MNFRGYIPIRPDISSYAIIVNFYQKDLCFIFKNVYHICIMSISIFEFIILNSKLKLKFENSAFEKLELHFIEVNIVFN